jgi:hypothetical protein
MLEFPDSVESEVTFDPRYEKFNMLAQRIAALRNRGSAVGAVVGATHK